MNADMEALILKAAEMANDWADKMIATGETYLQQQSEKESEKSTPAAG